MVEFFIQVIQVLAVPFCCIFAWAFLGLSVWSLLGIAQAGIAEAKHLHQIPCSSCSFCTGDYRLKCTVHPFEALTELAINCPDYKV